MSAAPAVKPKNLTEYYAALEAYGKQGVTHEGALRSAFQNLLAETGRRTGWTLIPELASGSIRPDGTFRDEYFLNRGYWEAKDTNDNLEAEIQKKIAKGYPLTNIIFEDTQRAPRRDLKRMYTQQLFANEVMLLPYYIAALNIEHAYYERTGAYEQFDGLCFVDTLELAEGSEQQFAFELR